MALDPVAAQSHLPAAADPVRLEVDLAVERLVAARHRQSEVVVCESSVVEAARVLGVLYAPVARIGDAGDPGADGRPCDGGRGFGGDER